MARHVSATWSDAGATFLLEVALDRARLKQRLAAVLYEERVKRGGGDARRFPQPKMAALLDYSLRQYQRLEDPDDGGLPSWADLERIADRLDLDGATLFGDDEREPTATRDEEIHALREELAEVRGMVAALLEGQKQARPAHKERRRSA